MAARYGPGIDGMSPTRMWVAEVNGRSVGFVPGLPDRGLPRLRRAHSRPGRDRASTTRSASPPGCGRGFGARVLWAWMVRARHRFPERDDLLRRPDHRNVASLRMLDKAGFVRGHSGSTSRRPTGTIGTVVGCTLDVRTVIG